MDVTRILEKLNPAQEQAVTSDKKHLLVLAGAGVKNKGIGSSYRMETGR